MTEFTDAVDRFVAEHKRAAGVLTWGPSRDRSGTAAYWVIETAAGLSMHRLYVVSYPSKPTTTFTVMVQFHWLDREYPVFRLNVEESGIDSHINRPPRPKGVPLFVSGNRIYEWKVNRGAFKPASSLGLPYCTPLPKPMTISNAIRHLASSANIDIRDISLPDAAPRLSLFP